MALIYGSTRPQSLAGAQPILNFAGAKALTFDSNEELQVDGNMSTSFTWTMPGGSANAVMLNPINLSEGVTYTFVITQNAVARTGGRDLWGTSWRFKDGGNPTTSTDPGKVDMLVGKALDIGGTLCIVFEGEVTNNIGTKANSWISPLEQMKSGYYKFDPPDATGEILDYSGNSQKLSGIGTSGAPVTPNGNPTFTTSGGVIGGSIVFDGASAAIDVDMGGSGAYWQNGINMGWGGYNFWSTSLWYKHKGDTGTIFQVCAVTPFLKLEVNNSTGFKPSYTNDSGVVKDDGFHLPAGGLVTDTWYHLAVTQDVVGGVAVVKLYVNATLLNTHSVTGWDGTPYGSVAGTNVQTCWGSDSVSLAAPTALTGMLECELDDHGIFASSALLGVEVAEIYNNGLAGISLNDAATP